MLDFVIQMIFLQCLTYKTICTQSAQDLSLVLIFNTAKDVTLLTRQK